MPHHHTLASALRFYTPRTSRDACWIWQGPIWRKPSGSYGCVTFKGQRYRAHRVAYQLAHGAIPDGLNVLHKCPGGGNSLCVNPAHLALGDAAENAQDMVTHDRQTKGADQHLAKLDDAMVLRMREMAPTSSLDKLAALFHLDKSTVSDAIRGVTWKHVPGALVTLDLHALHTQGSAQHLAKLTEDDVRHIRTLLGTMSQRAIARQFKVSFQTICLIHQGKTWKHVK